MAPVSLQGVQLPAGAFLSLCLASTPGADGLMGIYLFVIGAFDLKYSGEYNKHAQGWMASLQCQLVGSLAMLSSEVSVLLLTYMTLEKYFSIVFPFSHRRAGRKQTVSVLAVIWLLGFSLSLVPLWCKESFGNYYGRNGVCFPLQSDLGERPSARGYSTTIYLGEATGTERGRPGFQRQRGGSARPGLGRAGAAELPLPPLVGKWEQSCCATAPAEVLREKPLPLQA